MRTGLPLYGSSKNASLLLFHPEFFDSKFYNCRIQSRKFGFGVNIKSRKNGQNHWCAHTIPCNKTSKSREAISAGKLEFLRLYIRYNREIKTLMHFGTLAFGVHKTLLISVDGNEVLASRVMSLPTFSTMWWEQDYPLGEFEKCKFALFQPEFFDSKFNNCRIQ